MKKLLIQGYSLAYLTLISHLLLIGYGLLLISLSVAFTTLNSRINELETIKNEVEIYDCESQIQLHR